MLIDLTQPMMGLATRSPLPIRDGGNAATRDMTLRDTLLQVIETDGGPDRGPQGRGGPTFVQVYRLGELVRDADAELELGKNDVDLLKEVLDRSRGMAVLVGQAQAMLDEAEREWQAAKRGTQGGPDE